MRCIIPERFRVLPCIKESLGQNYKRFQGFQLPMKVWTLRIVIGADLKEFTHHYSSRSICTRCVACNGFF